MKKYKTIILLLIIAFLTQISSALCNNYHAEISLNGKWKFSIGDKIEWAKTNYDDSDWETIYAPKQWEEEGYRGYNGFAWYRLKIVVPESFKGRNVFIELGYIDDSDEVFFNGEKIGQSGTFPPKHYSAYNSYRKYQIPTNLIRYNEKNTIAVRVYDSQLVGGIVCGNLKIAAGEIAVIPDISLNGTWNFNKGKELKEKTEPIQVPGAWENNGYYNYDGYAVYSKVVNIPANFAKKKLIFLAGRIDDEDQFFINNQLIGETGNIYGNYISYMYTEFRNYFIPEGIIKPGNNLIVIKVLDRQGEGGIIEGNIGFISQDNFIKYWRLKRQE